MVAIESIGKSTVGGTKKRADIMVIAGHGGDKLTAQPAEPFLNRTEFAPLPGQEHPLSVFVQRNPSFGLPVDGDRPIIMVGPGTGIAPFRAFLQERNALGAKGKNWLFFGDQTAKADFLYREELEGFRKEEVQTRLTTAFSRDQTEKCYVQHRMRESADYLYAWLEDGACFYVCGDARRMAKDVDRALHDVIVEAGGCSPEQAAEYVARLKAEQRYRRDIYCPGTTLLKHELTNHLQFILSGDAVGLGELVPVDPDTLLFERLDLFPDRLERD